MCIFTFGKEINILKLDITSLLEKKGVFPMTPTAGVCKIAVPVTNGKLSKLLKKTEQFAVFKVDLVNGQIVSKTILRAPLPQPDLIPGWLQDRGVLVVIAGGLESSSLSSFQQLGIEVIIEPSSNYPGAIVQDYLIGALRPELML